MAKKVLYVATVLSHICQFHLPYLKMFKEDGYEVHVAARDNLAEKNGLQLEYADKHFEMGFQRSPFKLKNIAVYKQLKELINKEKYDIIVCNTPVGGILTRLAAKKARKNGTKVIYIAHGFHFYKGAPKKNWIIYYPIEKHFAKRCDVVVTITKEDYEFASKKFKTSVKYIHGMGVNDGRHYPIIEEQKLKLRNELGVSNKAFVCLCTGELNNNKNQKFLISLVPELKNKIQNFQLWLAGNGALKEELESEIEKLEVKDCVNLLGYQPQIEKFVRASDVVLSASKREGLPFNIIEAALAKRPVVASVNRGHRELIIDSQTGFMTNDRQEFVNKVLCLSEDKTLYEQIAEKAFINAQNYTTITTIEEFKQILGVLNG